VSAKHQTSTESTARPQPVRFHGEQVDRRRDLTLPAFVDDPSLTALVRKASAVLDGDYSASSNPYALQADTLGFLLTLLGITSPRSIVEFGSGASTKVFADWAAQHETSVTSVEHDRAWIEDVRRQLHPSQSRAIKLVHAPLRPMRGGFRQFMSYGALAGLVDDVRSADLFLLDGPHISGREIVLYFVLAHCRPGAVIVIDDLRHYAVLEMIAGLSPRVAGCFAAAAVDDNSHGLLVLKCLKTPGPLRVPTGSLKAILKSYWRCFRDIRAYGTGD
jgi:predicted O-methyltransferase YrrM